MKIACISASQVPSTTANSIQVMKVCQSLTQLGHQVRLLVPGSGTTAHPELVDSYGLQAEAVFEVEWLPSQPRLKRYDFALKAIRRARNWGAELAYVWPPQAAVLALVIKLPVVFELHGPPEGTFGPHIFRLAFKLPGKKRFLPITKALQRLFEATFGFQFSAGEVVVTPNGVDVERYSDLPEPTAARRQVGLPEGITAGYTGHLYPGRGMGLLVDLAVRFPQVHFLWVGGRPEDVSYWRTQLAENHITNVSLTGFVENSRLPLYQAAADILLMPYERQIAGSSGGNSAEYCSPMKMFEYMAAGRAILSSDLPVIHEVLNEENAVLCPPEDVDAWTKALQSLLADPSRRETLAWRSQQDVLQYTWLSRARKSLEGFI